MKELAEVASELWEEPLYRRWLQRIWTEDYSLDGKGAESTPFFRNSNDRFASNFIDRFGVINFEGRDWHPLTLPFHGPDGALSPKWGILSELMSEFEIAINQGALFTWGGRFKARTWPIFVGW